MTATGTQRAAERLGEYSLCKYREYLLLLQITDIRITMQQVSSPRLDGMPHGSGGHTDLSSYIAVLDERITELEAQAEKTQKALREIEDLIARVPDATQRMVLQARYIYGRKIEQIAEDLFYSTRHIHRIHSAGLDAILAILMADAEGKNHEI